MNIILLGAPGAGKGTVAESLVHQYRFTSISTGDIFRRAVKEETELGKEVKSIVESGSLVPDHLTIALVEECLSKRDWEKGFILDGFPRTLVQAESFYNWTKIPDNPKIGVVINFEIEKGELEERLSGRRVCLKCGAIYHVEFKPSKQIGVCDQCSGKLFQREDDRIELVKRRLDLYDKQTAPLVQFYQGKKMLRNIDARDKPEEVVKNIKRLLGI